MNSRSARAVAFFAVVYLLAGVVLGALAGRAASHGAVVAWRLTAWLISAAGFGAHIVHEQVRLGSSVKRTAWRAALAAALGAFGLAAAANIHALSISPPRHSPMLAFSLLLWPAVVLLPAFLAALACAALLARARRTTMGS